MLIKNNVENIVLLTFIENQLKDRQSLHAFAINETILAGADLGFSRGGRIFKKISKILTTFFLGRPN